MLRDLLRFYREAPRDADRVGDKSLGDYLAERGYGEAFIQDHLLPMAAAIWSTPAGCRGRPAGRRFHPVLRKSRAAAHRQSPEWRTVTCSSRAYVRALTARYADRLRVGCGIREIHRAPHEVRIVDAHGDEARYDTS